MNQENWFSQSLKATPASQINTPTRSNTPTRARRAPAAPGNVPGGLGDSGPSRVDQSLLSESLNLGKRYAEEYTPGGASKKVIVANASGSPISSPSLTGANAQNPMSTSLGGSGVGGSTSAGAGASGNMGGTGSPSATGGAAFGGTSLYNVTADQLTAHRTSSPQPYRTTRLSRFQNASTSTPSRGLRGSTSFPRFSISSPNTGGSPGERKRNDSVVVGSPGSGVGGAGANVDDDAPPTRSYLDVGGVNPAGSTEEQSSPGSYGSGGEVVRRRTPSGGELSSSLYDRSSTPSTSSLLILGVPYTHLNQLEPFLSRYGTLTSFELGPPDSNWVRVSYADPVVAMRLARQNGEVRFGGCLLGIVPQFSTSSGAGTTDSTASSPPISSIQRQRSHPTQVTAGPPPILSHHVDPSSLDAIAQPLVPIQRKDVFKPKTESKSGKEGVVVPPEFGFGAGTATQAQQGEQHAGAAGWTGGWLSKVGEIFFGR